MLARLWRSGSPLDAGALSGLVATAWALHAVADPLLRDLLATTALAALALGLVQESHRLAFVDELTGLPGRRALEAALAKAGRRYAVAMVDIDHFKRFNDRHGHDVGDQVLRLVASRLAGVGGGGRAYRYGGEEFTILFPGRSAESCVGLLERCREAVAAAEFRTRGKGRPAKPPKAGRPRRKADGARLSVTVSMGLAERGGRRRTRGGGAEGRGPGPLPGEAGRARPSGPRQSLIEWPFEWRSCYQGPHAAAGR